MIEIIVAPYTLTYKQTRSEFWKVQKILADQNLEVSKIGLWRRLNQGMPVKLSEKVQLIISCTKLNLKTKIDYSMIEDPQTKKLIRYYLTDKQAFVKEWFKL